MSRPALASAALLTALLLAGCGGEEAAVETRAAADRPAPSAEPTAPATSEPAGDGVLPDAPDASAPISGPAAAPDPTAAPAPPPPPVAGGGGTASPGTAPGPVVWPDEAVPTHGSRVWAVYLAVGSPIDPWQEHELAETADYAGFLGYAGSGIGSVSCDQGAAEQLGFDPDDSRVAVYFDSAARAQEFVLVYDRQDVSSAEVTTYCLD